MKNEETKPGMDGFEQRLQRQRLRKIPAAWRSEILSAATASSPRPSTLDSRPTSWWHELLWPCPQAWAGLAAVWVAVLAVNFATREQSPTLQARSVTTLSPDTLRLLKQQEQLLAELSGRTEARDADRPKTMPPRPRSERRDEMLNA